ncbi:MAG: hypothetical protein KBD25_06770 [Rickettsiaceae bacterium]|nr:hypothetical protein [Rickettsiaceae bacterium]
MLKINFYPDYDSHTIQLAANEYSKIWQEDGAKITEIIETISKIKFIEHEINAIIFEGRSYSNPLQLRTSYSLETKRCALTHELCHRICKANKLTLVNHNDTALLGAHKVIFLILFDVIKELYGIDIAKNNVRLESQYSTEYNKAWEWSLSKTPEERAAIFYSLIPKE